MNNSTQILIIEDEKNLGETLHDYLKNKNFSCDLAITAQMAEQKFKENNPNIVLMDIGLPDGSGIDLARKWREKSKNFVLLFLSAQNNPATRLEALELGGDDYITKPFELKELTLRLEKILKAQNFADTLPEIITHGPLKIYFKRFEIESAGGEIITLSQKECALLEMLYKNRKKAITRDEIIDEIWGENSFPSHRTIDNYIVKLRKWCESDSENHIQIKSIRGFGYMLETLN